MLQNAWTKFPYQGMQWYPVMWSIGLRNRRLKYLTNATNGIETKPSRLFSVLDACTGMTSLAYGKQIHAHILRRGFECKIVVGNSIVDKYTKCGNMEYVHQLFDKMRERDIASWSNMTIDYGRFGRGMDVIEVFQKMQQAGMKKNHINFVGVLVAYKHASLVDDGLH